MKHSQGESKSSAPVGVIDLGRILQALAKLVAVFLAVLICLRLPFVWIKLPAAIAVAYLGWRWILGARERLPLASSGALLSAKKSDHYRHQRNLSTLKRREAAVDQAAKPDQSALRLLVAYDAAGEFGKAKTLIQSLNGKEFPEAVAEELAVLAGNYFPIELEPTETGVRFKLA